MIYRTPHPYEILYGGDVALICGRDSEIHPDQPHGMFAADTRVLSTCRFRIAGYSWEMLSRLREQPSTARWNMQNPDLRVPSGTLYEASIFYDLYRMVGRGLRDERTVTAFTAHPVTVRFALLIDADFADIFEVKANSARSWRDVRRFHRGDVLTLFYCRGDFERGLMARVTVSHGTVSFAGSQIVFDVVLEPGRPWKMSFDARPHIGHQRHAIFPPTPKTTPAPLPAAFQITAAEPFSGIVSRAADDLGSLELEINKDEPFYAAGAPWFLTLFGRDSLLTPTMTGLLGFRAAVGALASLKRLQGTHRDDFRDEEPGKIEHEIRFGELAHFGKVPHSPYYGTWDAPALYVLALWNTWRWTGDRSLFDRFLDAAEKALAWCDSGGDSDHDGLLEYFTRSPLGYRNQSWKDADDAVPHEDGNLAAQPVATIEMQGYWYAARLAMAEMLEALGRKQEATDHRALAEQLRARVEQTYWLEDKGFYAMALDGRKRLVRSVASNPGHLLWCGLANPERAGKVAERLLLRDMFSGYGIRTLSSQHHIYNPLSYQIGSVWPHDNALIAAGFMRYGLRDEAATVLKGIIDAASTFEQERLPELFCGFARETSVPVPYARANVPQAWAAAAPVLMLQLFLGLLPDVPNGVCYLSPWLPEWLPRLEVNGISMGQGQLRVRLRRDGDRTVIENAAHPSLKISEDVPVAPLWGKPLGARQNSRS